MNSYSFIFKKPRGNRTVRIAVVSESEKDAIKQAKEVIGQTYPGYLLYGLESVIKGETSGR